MMKKFIHYILIVFWGSLVTATIFTEYEPSHGIMIAAMVFCFLNAINDLITDIVCEKYNKESQKNKT